MIKKIITSTLTLSIFFGLDSANARRFVVKGSYNAGWQSASDYIRKKDLNTIVNSINTGVPADAENNRAFQKSKCTIKLAQWTFKDVDTKGVTEDLVRQAVIYQMLAKQNIKPPEIQPVPGTKRLFIERWNKIRSLKENAACPVYEFECAEVSLTGAEYETKENYKDHAKKFLAEADKLIADGQAKANQCKQPLPKVIDLSSDVLFEFGSSNLSSTGRAKIAEFANRLIANFQKINQIYVDGHTDRIGSDSYNYQLSQQRALTVKKYLLIYAPNLRNEQILAQGFGKERPLHHCQGTKVTPELKKCLQPNRRVEISITQ